MNTAIFLLVLLPAQAQPLHLNLEQAYGPVDAKLQAGGAASLAFGDSTTFKGWTQPFRDQMQANWGDGGSGYQALSYHNAGGFNGNVWDVHNIQEDRAPHSGIDGLWAQTTAGVRTGQATHAVLTPVKLGAFELHYETQPGGGRFDVLNDTPQGRVLLGTVDTAGESNHVASWSGTAAGRLVFQPLDEGKPVKIYGINQSNDSGFRLDRAANGAWTTTDFLRRDESFEQQLKLLDDDLAIVLLGQNEQFSDTASYRARLESLCDRLLAANPDMSIVLMSPYQSGANATTLGKMAGEVATLAADRGLGFIDLFNAAGTYEFFQANDFLRDNVHTNDSGSAYLGNLIASALHTRGASLDNPVADVTGDLVVDLSDFGVMKKNFGKPLAKMTEGDVTRDGKVDLSDFGTLKAAFGRLGAAAAVPEPSTATLAAFALLMVGVLRLRWR